MTDIELARAKRQRDLELAADREVRDMACAAIMALPEDAALDKRATALALAILAIADSANVDRDAVVEAFRTIAINVPRIELVKS